MIKRLLVLPVVAAMGLAAVVAYGAWNGGGEHTATSASAVPSEGIDVHGNWHVAIYNQDGTLDRQYAFENALRPGAGDFLGHSPAAIVNPDGPHSATCWIGRSSSVRRRHPNSAGDPLPGRQSLQPFFPTTSATATPVDRGCFLTDDRRTTGPGFGRLVNVDRWRHPPVGFSRCHASRFNQLRRDAADASSRNRPGRRHAITGTDVGPYENIEAGQTIQVQVDITFATPAP